MGAFVSVEEHKCMCQIVIIYLQEKLGLCFIATLLFPDCPPLSLHSFPSQLFSLSVLTLCNPMDCSMPVFPVLHHLLELAQTHVHWVGDTTHPTISSSVIPFSSCLRSFPASGSFLMSQFFTLGGQSIGTSASASILMNIQDWFPLGLTGWIS